jgi:hypothetical protein
MGILHTASATTSRRLWDVIAVLFPCLPPLSLYHSLRFCDILVRGGAAWTACAASGAQIVQLGVRCLLCQLVQFSPVARVRSKEWRMFLHTFYQSGVVYLGINRLLVELCSGALGVELRVGSVIELRHLCSMMPKQTAPRLHITPEYGRGTALYCTRVVATTLRPHNQLQPRTPDRLQCTTHPALHRVPAGR